MGLCWVDKLETLGEFDIQKLDVDKRGAQQWKMQKGM
jgi:hypothetical protein